MSSLATRLAHISLCRARNCAMVPEAQPSRADVSGLRNMTTEMRGQMGSKSTGEAGPERRPRAQILDAAYIPHGSLDS